MWLWQLKNMHKHYYKQYEVWGTLFFISSLAHVFLLFFLFFMPTYQPTRVDLMVNRHLSRKEIDVLLAHAYNKRPVRKRGVIGAGALGVAGGARVKGVKKSVAAKAQKKEKAQAKKTASVTKERHKTALINKAEKKKREKKHTEQKRGEKKPVAKKQAEKKIEEKPVQKTEEQVPEEIVSPVAPALVPVGQDELMPVMIEEQDQDVESLLRYVALQKECARCWKPPVGVDKECACSIKVHVDQQGKAYAMEIVEKSGVMMFDIAAKAALYAMELPRWTHNKALVITFRQ